MSEAHDRVSDELRRANRALRTLRASNQVLVRATDMQELLDEICRVVVEIGGYRLAWVGFAEHDEARTVRPVAQHGFEEGYLASLDIVWADTKRGRGPTGTAIRTRKPAAAQHILTDHDFEPWRAEAVKRGYASSVAIPLIADKGVFGALNVYAEEPYAFDSDEISILTELTNDLAYGMAAHRTRAALETTEDRLKAFVTSTAHHLRTPLTSVVGFVELLRTNWEQIPDVVREEWIDQVSQGSCELSNIIEDLVVAARADLGLLRARPEVIDIQAEAQRVLKAFPTTAAGRITLEVPQTVHALADPAYFRQIMRALISNALKYGGEQIRIQIVGDGTVRVAIRDDGSGVPEARRQTIFEPSSRGHHIQGQPESMGLGLPVARTLAQLMSGTLTYRHEHGWSIFELALPGPASRT
ncbi:MAG: GAF domain-containing protein [Gammaproteobacteria bacterium]|nr:GAF domain-containing protein [Gammaproteobacteria bacterium]